MGKHSWVKRPFRKVGGNETVKATFEVGASWWELSQHGSFPPLTVQNLYQGMKELRKVWKQMSNGERRTPQYIEISQETYEMLIEQVRREFFLTQIRRVSFFWPPRNQVKQEAKVSRGYYRCAKCGDVFHYKQIQIDHIEPVIAVTGWVDYNTYVARLFCGVDGMQVLCRGCHAKKTKKENQLRKEN